MSETISWIFSLLVVGIPCWKILSKVGCNRGWVVLILIPYFGIFFYWIVLAVLPWPNARANVDPVLD